MRERGWVGGGGRMRRLDGEGGRVLGYGMMR
jgi:hypothetical protein